MTMVLRPYVAAVAFVVGAAPAHAGDPVFSGANAFGARATIPLAWGDYDNDGDADLAVGNYFGQLNELYENDDGTFTQRNEFGGGSTFAVAWADADNDGNLDLAVGNSGTNWLYINDGDGTFTQQTPFGANNTIALAWGDANGDGWLDLAVGNGLLGSAQQNFLYVNNGDGSFTEQAAFGTGQSASLAWADYDDDGDLDLAVGNGGFGFVGANALYLNDGTGTFTEELHFGESDTAVVAWADADNDGWFDLAAGNWNGGQNLLALNQGDGTFATAAAFGLRDTNTVAWGDFDLDGDQDLAVGNGDFTSADQNYLYENDGKGTFTEHAVFGLGSTDAVAWADYDGDGDLDLGVGNEHTPPQNELWTNQLEGADSLQMQLVGRFPAHGTGFSNSSAVGARVGLYEEGHRGEPEHLLAYQQVESKGGFSPQNDMVLTFGAAPAVVDVRIVWPGSGGEFITQDLPSVPMDQRLTIVETRPGDVNGDGVVSVQDLTEVILSWGPCPPPPDPCPADLDRNGVVDVADLVTVVLNWS